MGTATGVRAQGRLVELRASSRRTGLDADEAQLVATALDATFYTTRYPDVSAAKADPVEHYLKFGWREGRDPAPWFSTNAYLHDYPDVRIQEVNPFLHYLQWGRAEGRRITTADDGPREIAPVGKTGPPPRIQRIADEVRLLRFFSRLARSANQPSRSRSFDPVAYLILNPDVCTSSFRRNPAFHFDQHDRGEARLFSLADVLQIYFGTRRCDKLRFRSLLRAYHEAKRTNLARDPFAAAITALSVVGREHSSNASLQESVRLKRTTDRTWITAEPAPEALRTVTFVCHLYYMDEIDWIESVCARCKHFDGLRLRYVFSLSEAKASAEVIQRIRDRFAPSFIYLTENRGHDLGAVLSILRSEGFGDSEWIVTLHGKKSAQNDPTQVAGWKQAMADSIVAGLADINRAIKLNAGARLAGIGGYFALQWRRTNMARNARLVNELRRYLFPTVAPSNRVTYLSGSMMVTRSGIWREIAELTRECTFSETGSLAPEDRVDGLLEHAVERVIQELIEHRGLKCMWN